MHSSASAAKFSEAKVLHTFDSKFKERNLSSLGIDPAKTEFKAFKYRDGTESSYSDSEEVPHNPGEICVLGGRSLRNFIRGYPYRAKFVLVEISLTPYLLLFVAGFLRRYIVGRGRPNAMIRPTGFKRVPGKLVPYLVIENRNARVTTHFSISDNLKYEGLLDFLSEQNIDYVVLRFFENLPDRARPDGDLDMLVSDEGYSRVIEFLEKNSGPNMVDLYSVSSPANAARIPYYLPFLSKKMLAEKVITKDGYSVQTDENYLYSLIYHCLYHKGVSSGIASKYPTVRVSESPDNDYLAEIKNIADRVGVQVGDTLEELDSLLAEKGWKPHRDTLELVAPTNKWLQRHLESDVLADELGLFVLVLKTGFFEEHTIDKISKILLEHDFHIFRSEVFDPERKNTATDHLRGGNWSSTGEEKYNPSAAIVVGKVGVEGVAARAQNSVIDIRSFKLKLRKEFDVDHQSFIHITDTTHQSYEYFEVLYPELKNESGAFLTEYDLNFSKGTVSWYWTSASLRFFKAKSAIKSSIMRLAGKFT